jgi:hypothetical protein
MIERRMPPAGDPFTARKPGLRALEEIEQKLRHEPVDEKRHELREQVLRLRRAAPRSS